MKVWVGGCVFIKGRWRVLGEFSKLRGQIKMNIFLEKKILNTDGRPYGLWFNI